MFWISPTVWAVVVVALLVSPVLAVISFLGRPPTMTSSPGPRPA